VNISTQQRTEISQSFRSARIPSASVNISSVSVGTVLPSEVTFVEVPAEIIRIVPAWRSYRVVRVQEQILIVDPATRRIVYVL
jgi:hypothetical protein